jgi:tetratricopeptide (TPR) repeat protein
MNRKERRAAFKKSGSAVNLTSMRDQRVYDEALRFHQAGRFDAAEPLFRRVLASDPRHAHSLHFLGEIARRSGRLVLAVALIEKAIAIDPGIAAYHYNLANTQRDQGRLDDAVASYGRALALAPEYAEAHNNLGLVLERLGRLDEAASHYHRTLTFRPDFAAAHNNLANLLKHQGKLDEAIASYRTAISLNPAYPDAHHNLGIVLRDIGRLNEAIACYRHALTLRPAFSETLNNLGIALKDQGRFDEAIDCFRQILAREPDNSEAHNNLGNAQREAGRLDEAVSSYRNALAIKPDNPEAPNNLGIALHNQGRLDEALVEYRTALAAAPDNADFHWNLALAHLQRGDFSIGWREYEWRVHTRHYVRRTFSKPAWKGDALNEQTILLYAEQGNGDTIQFARYARLVKDMGAARVVVECQAGLARLLQDMSGIDSVVTAGEALPFFDCHASLLSLPFLFETVLETIPATVPYLQPNLSLAEAWRTQLKAQGPNIGLVWRGSAEHKNDRWRSIAPASLAEICVGSNVNWYSLQKDARPDEIKELSRYASIQDCGADLHDWADTGALVSGLDLVVTVDTGVAHLAGALGRPVWVLLPFNPDWRWLLDRSDSPWYPTMRLFRQPSPGDWEGVFTQVRKALKDFSDIV